MTLVSCPARDSLLVSKMPETAMFLPFFLAKPPSYRLRMNGATVLPSFVLETLPQVSFPVHLAQCWTSHFVSFLYSKDCGHLYCPLPAIFWRSASLFSLTLRPSYHLRKLRSLVWLFWSQFVFPNTNVYGLHFLCIGFLSEPVDRSVFGSAASVHREQGSYRKCSIKLNACFHTYNRFVRVVFVP